MPDVDTSFDVEAFEAEARAERAAMDRPVLLNREPLFAALEKRMPRDIREAPKIRRLMAAARERKPGETHAEYVQRVHRVRIEEFGVDEPRQYGKVWL